MRIVSISISLLAFFFFSACSSTQKTSNTQEWIDLFTSSLESQNAPAYTIERVEQDYQNLINLRNELVDLTQEIAQIKRRLHVQETPYLSDAINKEIELAIFRSISARDALGQLVNYYRNHVGDNKDTHNKGAVLGMYSALTRYYYGSYFCALFHDEPDMIKVLNTAHPRYDLPKDSYDKLFYNLTKPESLKMLDLSWYLFSKELNNSDSTLSEIKRSGSKYSNLITQMDRIHADTKIQTNYLLYSDRHILGDIRNYFRQSEVAKLGKLADESLDENLYKTRGFVFKNVARIQRPDSQLLKFSDAQVKEIHDRLQPGDIILTYTAGYMSNVFLPGNFKHGITYIGTPEERRAAGLTDAALENAAISPAQAERLIQNVAASTTAEGETVDIIEAVSEGVILNSLDKILKTHINRMVVIRPKITSAEKLQQLTTVFQYLGATYDFKFNFQDDTYQCCTELVYRSINGMSGIDFSLVHMQGRWILAADDILNYYLSQNPDAFEFVLLADQSADSDDFQAVISEGAEGLNALYELMNVQRPNK